MEYYLSMHVISATECNPEPVEGISEAGLIFNIPGSTGSPLTSFWNEVVVKFTILCYVANIL